MIACDGLTRCVTKSDNSVTCKCTSCAYEYKPVCASDGHTYASSCFLENRNCKENTNLQVAKSNVCGKFNIIINYFFWQHTIFWKTFISCEVSTTKCRSCFSKIVFNLEWPLFRSVANLV